MIPAEPRYVFHTQQSDTAPNSLNNTDLAFIGEGVDGRGSATIKKLKEASQYVSSLRFDARNQITYLDSKETNRERLVSHVRDKAKILIDATTLGLGEILQILLAVKKAGNTKVEFLYAEPKEYTRNLTEKTNDPRLRDFSLTENCNFCSVLGFAHEYQSNMRATHIFLLGFERARMLSALEQRNDFNRELYHCHIIFGVPAFSSGWESNSIRPHLSILTEEGIGEHSITYCQANSIREAYLTLWDLYLQLGNDRGCFYVSPLGTKPHAIGTALFLLETKGNDIPTSLYYDHPERKYNRSSETKIWHHVHVQFP